MQIFLKKMNGVSWVRACALELFDEIISCLDFVSIQAVPNYRHTPCYAFHGYHHNMATKKRAARTEKRRYQKIIQNI